MVEGEVKGDLGRLSLYGRRPFPFWYTIGANYNRKKIKSCDPRQCPVFPFRAAKGTWYVKCFRLKEAIHIKLSGNYMRLWYPCCSLLLDGG